METVVILVFLSAINPLFLGVFLSAIIPLFLGAFENNLKAGLVATAVLYFLLILPVTMILEHFGLERQPFSISAFGLLLSFSYGIAAFCFFRRVGTRTLSALVTEARVPSLALLFAFNCMLMFIFACWPRLKAWLPIAMTYALPIPILCGWFILRIKHHVTLPEPKQVKEPQPAANITEFIVERVEEEPAKSPFVCQKCGAKGGIPRDRLPKNDARIRIRCPKCGASHTIRASRSSL